MNSAMHDLLSKLTTDPNTAIVLIDDRPRGGKIHISTIQLAIENPQPVPEVTQSPERQQKSILKFTPSSTSSPNFKIKNPLNESILSSTRKLRSMTKRVHFSSPQVVDIPTIDERMKIPMTAKLTTEQLRYKTYTPIRTRAVKPRNLSFTDSSDKKKKLKQFRSIIESSKVEKTRGDLKLKAVSRIPKRISTEAPKSPEKITKAKKIASPINRRYNLRSMTRSPGFKPKQENLLKANGVKLNRRFELMMDSLVNNGEKNTRRTL